MPTVPTPRTTRPMRWHQESLLPPDVLEITVRLGVVNSADHLQVQIEAREANGVLVYMYSRPHQRLHDLMAAMGDVVEEVSALLHPF